MLKASIPAEDGADRLVSWTPGSSWIERRREVDEEGVRRTVAVPLGPPAGDIAAALAQLREHAPDAVLQVAAGGSYWHGRGNRRRVHV